jgi:hypothetical protein
MPTVQIVSDEQLVASIDASQPVNSEKDPFWIQEAVLSDMTCSLTHRC